MIETTHRIAMAQAIEAALKGATLAGSNVYNSETFRLGAHKIPAILFYFDREMVATRTVAGPRVKDRTAELVVAAVVESDGQRRNIELVMGQIEAALENSNRLGGLAKSVTHAELRNPPVESVQQSGKEAGLTEAALGFRVVYYTREGDPTKAL